MTAVTPAEGAQDVPRKGYLPRIGSWLSAALDDPNVCADMKADILAWFDADMPAPDLAAALTGMAHPSPRTSASTIRRRIAGLDASRSSIVTATGRWR